MASMRCKLTGCDLDECGVCRRCRSPERAQHDWAVVDRERPCFELKRCTRCDEKSETPDHDWEAKPGIVADIEMTCSRCNLKI